MRRTLSLYTLTMLLLVLVTACSSVGVNEYRNRTPKMIPEQFFDGKLTAHGVVKNRSGRVIRTFNADIIAYWQGDRGTLEEDFIFDDGEKQRRVWTLTRQENGDYTGTAGDVIGTARGRIAGNSMFLHYLLAVPYKGDTINLTIDDRMYLVAPNTLINESVMSKLGLRVGEIVLVILKQ